MSGAETRWKKANRSYENYVAHIKRKKARFKLSIKDLLYVRNFKEGNASIHEPEQKVRTKLKAYSTRLRRIAEEFNNRRLENLGENQLKELIGLSSEFLALTKEHDTKIDGFDAIRAAALLHFYFPNLLPIMDRWVIRAVCPLSKNEKPNIFTYILLIKEYRKDLKKKCNKRKSLRDLDKIYFIKGHETK